MEKKSYKIEELFIVVNY